jgi:hypothetical protein
MWHGYYQPIFHSLSTGITQWWCLSLNLVAWDKSRQLSELDSARSILPFGGIEPDADIITASLRNCVAVVSPSDMDGSLIGRASDGTQKKRDISDFGPSPQSRMLRSAASRDNGR